MKCKPRSHSLEPICKVPVVGEQRARITQTSQPCIGHRFEEIGGIDPCSSPIESELIACCSRLCLAKSETFAFHSTIPAAHYVGKRCVDSSYGCYKYPHQIGKPHRLTRACCGHVRLRFFSTPVSETQRHRVSVIQFVLFAVRLCINESAILGTSQRYPGAIIHTSSVASALADPGALAMPSFAHRNSPARSRKHTNVSKNDLCCEFRRAESIRRVSIEKLPQAWLFLLPQDITD